MATAATAGLVPESQRTRCPGVLALLLGSLALAPIARADVTIPASGFMALAGGAVDAACTDLFVAGTLNLDAGAVFNVRDIIVQAGGVLNGGGGSITLSRNFTVAPGGAFNVQAATVAYDATCGPGAAPAPIPTLGSALIAALSGVLAALAMFCAGGGAPLRRKNAPKGAGP